MKYKNIVKGIFRERPNRFIAYVDVEGMDNNPQIVHVKNTGRCKELLVDGATVYLEEIPAFRIIFAYTKSIHGTRKLLITV